MSTLTDINWRLRGHCRVVDPEVMYPDSNAADEFRAKRICNGCPVATECFLDSIRLKDFQGVRAGMTGKERRSHAERREHRNCVDCGTQYTPRQDAQKRCRPCSRTHKQAKR